MAMAERAIKKLLAVVMTVCIVLSGAFLMPDAVHAASTTPDGAESLTAGQWKTGRFTYTKITYGNNVQNGTYMAETLHYYKFRTGSTAGATYVVKANYASFTGYTSDDHDSAGISVKLLDSNFNDVKFSSGYNTAGYYDIRLMNSKVGSMTYTNLKPNADYYVVVNSDSGYDRNAIDYKVCYTTGGSTGNDPNGTQSLTAGQWKTGRFTYTYRTYGNSGQNGVYMENTHQYYKFRTGSTAGATYVVKANYASFTGYASDDHDSQGISVKLLDSNFNEVKFDSGSNTWGYYGIALQLTQSGSAEYSNLKTNADYYVEVESNSGFDCKYKDYKVCYTTNDSGSGDAGESATGIEIDKQADMTVDTDGDYVLNLRPGEKRKLTYHFLPQNAAAVPIKWDGDNDAVASVDQDGTVTAHSAGTTRIYVNAYVGGGWTGSWVKVNVSDVYYFDSVSIVTVKGSKYEVRKSGQTGEITVSLVRAKNAKNVTIPSKIRCNDGVTRAVTGIKAEAFKGSKAKTVTIKTRMLTKESVKNSLKASKVKTIKVKTGNKKLSKTFVKKYKKIFTKKNCGKKVKVKR